MSEEEQLNAAMEAMARLRADMDNVSSVDRAASEFAELAQLRTELFCDFGTALIGLVAARRIHCDRASVLSVADLLETLCVEQNALRALAYLSHQRGRHAEAAAFQARSLAAPDSINEAALMRLARMMDAEPR